MRRGNISKEGCKLVRWAAVEAIQRSCDPAVKKVKDDIVARRGIGARNVAKVAAGAPVLVDVSRASMPKGSQVLTGTT